MKRWHCKSCCCEEVALRGLYALWNSFHSDYFLKVCLTIIGRDVNMAGTLTWVIRSTKTASCWQHISEDLSSSELEKRLPYIYDRAPISGRVDAFHSIVDRVPQPFKLSQQLKINWSDSMIAIGDRHLYHDIQGCLPMFNEALSTGRLCSWQELPVLLIALFCCAGMVVGMSSLQTSSLLSLLAFMQNCTKRVIWQEAMSSCLALTKPVSEWISRHIHCLDEFEDVFMMLKTISALHYILCLSTFDVIIKNESELIMLKVEVLRANDSDVTTLVSILNASWWFYNLWREYQSRRAEVNPKDLQASPKNNNLTLLMSKMNI